MGNDITSTVTMTQANLWLTSSGGNALDVVLVVLVVSAAFALLVLGLVTTTRIIPLGGRQ